MKRIEVITPNTVEEVVEQVMLNIEQQKKKRYCQYLVHGIS